MTFKFDERHLKNKQHWKTRQWYKKNFIEKGKRVRGLEKTIFVEDKIQRYYINIVIENSLADLC